jgi:hypothetical protein
VLLLVLALVLVAADKVTIPEMNCAIEPYINAKEATAR